MKNKLSCWNTTSRIIGGLTLIFSLYCAPPAAFAEPSPLEREAREYIEKTKPGGALFDSVRADKLRTDAQFFAELSGKPEKLLKDFLGNLGAALFTAKLAEWAKIQMFFSNLPLNAGANASFMSYQTLQSKPKIKYGCPSCVEQNIAVRQVIEKYNPEGSLLGYQAALWAAANVDIPDYDVPQDCYIEIQTPGGARPNAVGDYGIRASCENCNDCQFKIKGLKKFDYQFPTDKLETGREHLNSTLIPGDPAKQFLQQANGLFQGVCPNCPVGIPDCVRNGTCGVPGVARSGGAPAPSAGGLNMKDLLQPAFNTNPVCTTGTCPWVTQENVRRCGDGGCIYHRQENYSEINRDHRWWKPHVLNKTSQLASDYGQLQVFAMVPSFGSVFSQIFEKMKQDPKLCIRHSMSAFKIPGDFMGSLPGFGRLYVAYNLRDVNSMVCLDKIGGSLSLTEDAREIFNSDALARGFHNGLRTWEKMKPRSDIYAWFGDIDGANFFDASISGGIGEMLGSGKFSLVTDRWRADMGLSIVHNTIFKDLIEKNTKFPTANISIPLSGDKGLAGLSHYMSGVYGQQGIKSDILTALPNGFGGSNGAFQIGPSEFNLNQMRLGLEREFESHGFGPS